MTPAEERQKQFKEWTEKNIGAEHPHLLPLCAEFPALTSLLSDVAGEEVLLYVVGYDSEVPGVVVTPVTPAPDKYQESIAKSFTLGLTAARAMRKLTFEQWAIVRDARKVFKDVPISEILDSIVTAEKFMAHMAAAAKAMHEAIKEGDAEAQRPIPLDEHRN